MITELTKEQLDQIPAFVDKWLKIGLNTDPLDLPKAIEAVAKAYKAAGLEPPKHHFVFASPLGASIAAAILKHITDDQIADLAAAKPEEFAPELLRKVFDETRKKPVGRQAAAARS